MTADETHAAVTRAAMARMRARRRAEGRRDITLTLPSETIARLDALAAAARTGRAETLDAMIRRAAARRGL